jgi:hypothetical protein
MATGQAAMMNYPPEYAKVNSGNSFYFRKIEGPNESRKGWRFAHS